MRANTKSQGTLRFAVVDGVAPSIRRIAVGILLLLLMVAGCTHHDSITPQETFSGEEAYHWIIAQCELGYRTPGSEAHRQVGDLIVEQLRTLGWQTREQRFTYRDTPIRNLLAWQGEGPAVLLGAHYDTRPSADEEDPDVPVMGANDGASGVAVLLELARVLDAPSTGQRVYLAFFDAEDSGGLDGWDWIVGSSHMAERWGEGGEPPLKAVVVVDMIGDRDLQIHYEYHSDVELQESIWRVADDLGYGDSIIPTYKYAILDDHIPFLRRGIPAVVMIDFDYPYWHTTQDTPDKVAPQSLEAVGRTLQVWLESR